MCTNLYRYLLLLSVASWGTLAAQTDAAVPDSLIRIVTVDGLELLGYPLFDSADSLSIRTPSGAVIGLHRRYIASTNTAEGAIVDGSYRRYDPNRSRLLLSPTARPLRSGSGYFAVYEIFFPFLAAGIADVVTLSGGLSLVPGAPAQLFYVGPKVSFPLDGDRAYLAAGGVYINETSGESEGVGLVYGVGTFGAPDAAVTLGAGWGFSGEDFSDKPVLLVGGELQMSGSVKLVTENLVPIASDVALLSLGIRFFGDNLAADFALWYPLTDETTDGLPVLPWLGLVYNFGD